MATTASVNFAGGSKVYVQAFSNAAFAQVVTITPPSGTAAVFQGSGEGNIALPLTTSGFLTAAVTNGQPSFTPPGSSSKLSTYTVMVTANGSSSQVEANSFSVTTPANGSLNLATVVSEDSTDKDYNDATAVFMQYTKPTT